MLKSLRMSGLRRDISHLVLNRKMLVLMMWLPSLMNQGQVFLLLCNVIKHVFSYTSCPINMAMAHWGVVLYFIYCLVSRTLKTLLWRGVKSDP